MERDTKKMKEETNLIDVMRQPDIVDIMFNKLPLSAMVNIILSSKQFRWRTTIQSKLVEIKPLRKVSNLIDLFDEEIVSRLMLRNLSSETIVNIALTSSLLFKNINIQRYLKVKQSRNFSNIMDNTSMKELLSYLPVEELKRFAIVSKSWSSLLLDSAFIELHLGNTKLRSRILMVTSENNSMVFSQYSFRDKCEILLKVSIPRCSCSGMKPINGLMCLYDRRKHMTRIFNPSTGQKTPWARTSIGLEDAGTLVTAVRGFGFDSVSGKYKVLAIWEISQNYPENGMLIGKVNYYFEALTVGENKWRKIFNRPPPTILLSGPCVYANGSIYRRNRGIHFSKAPSSELIVAFDLQEEIFRVIEIPRDVLDTVPESSPRRGEELLKVDNRISIIDRVDDRNIKLWISDDEPSKVSSSIKWISEDIKLPFIWKLGHNIYVSEVESTKELVIRSTISSMNSNPEEFVLFFLYDRVRKICRQIDITGLSLKYPFRFGMFVYNQSLLQLKISEDMECEDREPIQVEMEDLGQEAF